MAAGMTAIVELLQRAIVKRTGPYLFYSYTAVISFINLSALPLSRQQM